MHWSWRAIAVVSSIATMIIFVPLAVLALRNNNLKMAELRQVVIQADQNGQIENIKSAATQLQQYVVHHMNTNTGKLALIGLYDHDAKQKVSQSLRQIDQTNYHIAEKACASQLHEAGYRALATCIANKVGLADYTVQPLDASPYYINYLAPTFSFDLAGCLILVIVLAGCTLLVGVVASIIVKLMQIKSKNS